MNKFLLFCFLFFAFSPSQGDLSAAVDANNQKIMAIQLCMDAPHQVKQDIVNLTYNTAEAEFFSTNCATPTMLTSGIALNGTWTGPDLYYQINAGAGALDISFVGANLSYEVIDNCTNQNPQTPPFCTGGTYLIKVTGTSSGPFTLTATSYTPVVTISFTESSGTSNNDGVVCEGSSLTLTANVAGITPPSAVTSYDWSSGQPTQTFTINPTDPSHAGTYTVTVTDDNGCTHTTSRIVVVNPLPTAAIAVSETSGVTDDGEICNGDQATLTASGGNTYAWSNGPNVATNTVAPTTTTTYTVTITDTNGCTDTETQVITVNPLPVAAIAIAETSGNTDNDGDICENDPITLTATGGSAYEWSTTETTDAISPTLAVGMHTFTVTVTDANGCTDSQIVDVEVFPEATATVVITETSGLVNNDGNLCLNDQLTLTASGGTTYVWNTGASGSVLNDFPPVGMQTYTVTVTDANGCTASTETAVEVFDLPIADIAVTDMSAEFDDDGLICAGDNATLTASGGTTYVWSDGSMSDILSVSPAVGLHTYTVTVTDANGCTDTEDIDVEVFALPMPTIAIVETSGTTNNDGMLCAGDDLTLTASDPDPMTTFEWQLPDGSVVAATGLNITNIDNTFNGLYTVTADNNGCTNTATVTITVNDPPDPEIQFMGDPSNFNICEDEAFNLDVVTTMGTAPFTYSWTLPNNSTGSGNPYSVAAADQAIHHGVWVVTVTDANGCTGTDNIGVTVDPAPTNNSCATAADLGSGTGPLNVSGNNVCAGTGGACGSPDDESTVYFVYTVPPSGLTDVIVIIEAPFSVTVGSSCGGGECGQQVVVDCPPPNSTIYVAVSSSEANEGNFSFIFRPNLATGTIMGTVYIDLDASGTFGGTDVGFQGAPVQLIEGCGGGGTVVATAITDANGNYTFNNVPPGMYLVQVEQGGAGAPTGSPTPKNCCLTVDPCMPDAILTCDMGYPPPDCTSNPYSVDNLCEDAYNNPLCDLRVIGDFACGQNPLDLGPWSPQAHCAGVYHNTSFYGFVAGTGNYSIQFTIFACAGTGVQYGLMDVCSPGGPYVVCNGNANTGTVTVDASQLEPCKTYVFWIDGFSGSVCSYYIQVVGDFHVCEIPPIYDITIDHACTMPLCPVQGTLPVTVVGAPGVIPALENINGLELHWDITLNGSPYISTITQAQTDGLTIDVPFIQAGTYEVCVNTWHPCPKFGTPKCKKFVFEDLKDVEKEFKICTADFPWEGEVDPLTMEPVLDPYGNQWAWIGGPINLSDIRTSPPRFLFSSPYYNECGCPYTQHLRIKEVGISTGTDSIAICQNQVPYMYHDTTFATDVTDLLYKLKGIKTKNGCDSLVSITTRILRMGGTITDECIQGGLQMQFNMGLPFIAADRDSIKYVWKDATGSVLADNDSDGTNIVVAAPGTYSLEISVYKFGKSCIFPFTHAIDLTGRFPAAPLADNWPQKICENDNLATYNVLTPDPTLIYLWTVPNTATKVQDDSTGTLVVRWNGPTGGNICVKARNLCGDGPETCLPVVYVDMIVPDFSLAAEVCKDNTTPITATSTHTATPVVYNWNFNGGTTTTGTSVGPGPHNVSWNDTGIKTVSLSVSENGCLGDPVTKDIEVKENPAPPIVSCAGTTSSSVTFEWTAVPGATSYNIIRVSGAANPGSFIGATKYEVTGLNLSDCVEIKVEAVLPPVCGNVISEAQECCAQDCGTLPTITISPIAPICLPGNTVALNQSLVTVTPPVANSTGTFTINGTPSTIFDPVTLGAGTHTIQYTLTWDLNRCSQSATLPVIVRPTPKSDFTISPGGCVLDPVTVTYTGGTTGATFTWNFGADVIGTYNGPGPHQVTWTNAGQKTITLSVTKNGCTSTVTTHTVTVNPVLTAPTVSCADQRIDGVTFGWLAVANASGYNIKVDIVGGANVFTGTVTGTTYDVPGLTEGTQVTITVTAISNNGCPNTTSTGTCKATACPNAKITFPNKVITECLTSSLANISLPYTITNNIPNEVPTVTWSSSDPLANSAINNGVNPATFNPQIAKAGTHTLVLTYQQKDCIWKDSILVTLKPVPVASFTSDDKICVTDNLLVTYTGTSTSGRVLTWEHVGATKTDISPTTFNFNWTTPGTYKIGLDVTLVGCKSSPQFTKNVVVEAIPDSTVITCKETLDKIEFNWTALPCASDYKVTAKGMLIGNLTSLTHTEIGLLEGEFVDILIEPTSICECPIPPSTLTCQAKACPPVNITLSPAQTSICLVPNVGKIKVNLTVTGNTPDGKGTWSGTGVDQNGNFDPAVAGLGEHTLTYSYEDSNCSFTKTTKITVNELPKIVWEAVQPKCYNDVSGSFIFTISGGQAPYKTTMDGSTISGSPVIGVTAGNHTFVVTDINGCSSSITFDIKIPSQPSFEIKGPGIVNINREATHTLDLTGMAAYINAIDSVVWVQNGKRVCSGGVATCSSITNIPKLGPNEYMVTIYYNNGCKVTDVFPYVVTDLFITTFPEIFNPESTNGNNTFHITTSDPSLFVKKMRVYDRWGNLVFIAENFSAFTDPIGWNGKVGSDVRGGGTHVVPGVYVYIFEMSSDSESEIIEAGDVTVIR